MGGWRNGWYGVCQGWAGEERWTAAESTTREKEKDAYHLTIQQCKQQPPSPDAKLLTKVVGGEVQVLAHFSDAGLTGASLPATHMHLSDRLQQLIRSSISNLDERH